jgi:hypothetical protein
MLKRHLAPQTLERLLHNELCPKEPASEGQNLAQRLKKQLNRKEKETDGYEK